jgi:hypothetical protein
VAVRPRWRERDRCGVCRRRCPGFDLGEGRRRWRALDLGSTFAFVEAQAPRVACRDHGVVVCAVPWARHRSRFTRVFEDQTAWLAVHCSKSAVAALMRVAWRTVGGICERVAADAQREVDLLAGLRRIGIEEQPSVTPVWTGPESPAPQGRLTLAVLADLIDEAQNEIVLVSYATLPSEDVRAALSAATSRGVEVTMLLERAVDNPASTVTASPSQASPLAECAGRRTNALLEHPCTPKCWSSTGTPPSSAAPTSPATASSATSRLEC